MLEFCKLKSYRPLYGDLQFQYQSRNPDFGCAICLIYC